MLGTDDDSKKKGNKTPRSGNENSHLAVPPSSAYSRSKLELFGYRMKTGFS